jgi:acetylglutamate kinase
VYEVQLYDNGKLGHVGEIIDVNLDPINEAIESGCVPVLTCMGQTADGQFLNVNADTAAQMLSQAIKPMKVVYISSNGGMWCKHETNYMRETERERERERDGGLILCTPTRFVGSKRHCHPIDRHQL